MTEIAFKKVELEHRELISGYFRRYPSRSCERTPVVQALPGDVRGGGVRSGV